MELTKFAEQFDAVAVLVVVPVFAEIDFSGVGQTSFAWLDVKDIELMLPVTDVDDDLIDMF